MAPYHPIFYATGGQVFVQIVKWSLIFQRAPPLKCGISKLLESARLACSLDGSKQKIMAHFGWIFWVHRLE